MSRAVGIIEAEFETALALAKHHLGRLEDPRAGAERLSQLPHPARYYLAQLWSALGDATQARDHAVVAYKEAWADGEPYVLRYDLTKATEMLQQLNTPLPSLPPYNSMKHAPFPWEAKIRAAIEKLRRTSNG